MRDVPAACWRRLAGAGFALVLIGCGEAQEDRPATASIVRPAADGIFEAFETHPIVGLGDSHGFAEEMDFYAALVADPRFAREVGNLVVEFGGAIRQDVVDRYVAGDTVPYTELRQVWTDTVGWYPSAGLLGFVKLLAQVRTTNKTLPSEERIRVWLGEPPINWSIADADASKQALRRRDSYPASIVDDILARGEKALVIYGSLHFTDGARYTLGPLPLPIKVENIRTLVEAEHPDAVFVVLPYDEVLASLRPDACAQFIERAAEVLPAPAIAMPSDGGAPEPGLTACATLDQADLIANGLLTLSGVEPSRVRADGVLLLGVTFTRGELMPDIVLDPEYRLEIDRRIRLQTGQPLFPASADFAIARGPFEIDLDAPGYVEMLDAMFARHDRNGDSVVTAGEYTDPIQR